MKSTHWLAIPALLTVGLISWSLKEILVQIFAGIVLARALCTLVEKLRSKVSINRTFALLICILGILILFSLFIIIVIPPFSEEFEQIVLQLPNAASAFYDLARENLERINEIIYGNNQTGNIGKEIFSNGLKLLPDSSALATGVGDGIKQIIGLAGNLSTSILQLLFILAVSLMVAIQPNAYLEVAILLIPSFYRKRARSILQDCGTALSNWMNGVLISSLCVAILAGIGLSLLGVKLVIANALLAGMLNVIPNVGPVISTIFPLSVALLDAPWKAVAVLGLYIFIQNLESYLITPSVMHHQVKLLPGLTLAAQFIFTVVFGPIGLILALPLAVVLQVLIKEVIVHDILDNWKRKQFAR